MNFKKFIIGEPETISKKHTHWVQSHNRCYPDPNLIWLQPQEFVGEIFDQPDQLRSRRTGEQIFGRLINKTFVKWYIYMYLYLYLYFFVFVFVFLFVCSGCPAKKVKLGSDRALQHWQWASRGSFWTDQGDDDDDDALDDNEDDDDDANDYWENSIYTELGPPAHSCKGPVIELSSCCNLAQTMQKISQTFPS